MAKFYNRKVSEREPGFKVGDSVILNAKDFKTLRPSKKLDHKMRGKFMIKRLIVTNGSMAGDSPFGQH